MKRPALCTQSRKKLQPLKRPMRKNAKCSQGCCAGCFNVQLLKPLSFSQVQGLPSGCKIKTPNSSTKSPMKSVDRLAMAAPPPRVDPGGVDVVHFVPLVPPYWIFGRTRLILCPFHQKRSTTINYCHKFCV